MILHTITDLITCIAFCILSALGVMTLYMLLTLYPRLKQLIDAAIDIRYIAYLLKKDFEERVTTTRIKKNE